MCFAVLFRSFAGSPKIDLGFGREPCKSLFAYVLHFTCWFFPQAQKETDPEERPVLERSSKQCHIILEICKTYKDHAGADNREFFLAAMDLQKFMRLSPVVAVGFPFFIQNHLFHGQAMDLTGKEFWEFMSKAGLAGKYGIEDANEAKITEVQPKFVAEKIVDITKTKETCNKRLGIMFEEDFWGGGVVTESVAREVDWVRCVVKQLGTVPELEASLAACRNKDNTMANALLLYPAGRDVWHEAYAHKESLELSDKLFKNLNLLAEELAGDKRNKLTFKQNNINIKNKMP